LRLDLRQAQADALHQVGNNFLGAGWSCRFALRSSAQLLVDEALDALLTDVLELLRLEEAGVALDQRLRDAQLFFVKR